jgi:hypothetical protein
MQVATALRMEYALQMLQGLPRACSLQVMPPLPNLAVYSVLVSNLPDA